MATAIATKASATGANGDVTVTKPTDLAVGDIMVAFIHSRTAGTNEETHTGPSGWTKIVDIVPNNGSVLTVWAIVATSTETAASDFAWASGGDNGESIGTIYRITGTSGFLSLDANVVSTGANSNDYPTPSYTGLTTIAANSLLLLGAASETTGGSDVDFTAYTVANNNPSWNEEDDLGNGGGSRANLAVASATYAPMQATGNFTVTLDFDGGDCSAALVAITENVSVTASPAVIEAALSIQAPTVSAGATVTIASPVTITSSVVVPTVSLPPHKWANSDKNAASATNLTKNAASPSNLGKSTYLADSYSETNGSGDWATYSPYTIEVQSFTGVSGILSSCKFYLAKTGSPTGSIYAVLYAHTGTLGVDGTPTGDALATSDAVNIANFTGTYTLTTFTFTGANRIPLDPAVNYCIGYTYTGGDASNHLLTRVDDTSPTHAGNLAEWDGSEWLEYGSGGTSQDLPFYLYLTGSAISNVQKS